MNARISKSEAFRASLKDFSTPLEGLVADAPKGRSREQVGDVIARQKDRDATSRQRTQDVVAAAVAEQDAKNAKRAYLRVQIEAYDAAQKQKRAAEYSSEALKKTGAPTSFNEYSRRVNEGQLAEPTLLTNPYQALRAGFEGPVDRAKKFGFTADQAKVAKLRSRREEYTSRLRDKNQGLNNSPSLPARTTSPARRFNLADLARQYQANAYDNLRRQQFG